MRSESSKVIGYKVNTQKSIICLFDSNEELETKFKAQCHLQLLQKIKCMNINATKNIDSVY